MPKELALEEYRDRFYQNFPEKSYIKFIEKQGRFLIVEDKFGICKIAHCHLMKGYCPTIRVAVDKNSYFIKKAKQIHGDLYDYSKAEYTGLDNNVILICSKHGEFKITPHSHIGQKAGCNSCGYERSSIKNGNNANGWKDSDWYNKAKNSKNFNSFKVYIIKCWDKNEEFYKIGKTFKILNKRFCKDRMPYSWEIIKVYEFKELSLENAKLASILERKLKDANKENQYKPLKEIRGKFECFKQINLG